MDYSKIIDRQLVISAKEGDAKASEALFFRYRHFIYNHWAKLRKNLEKINNKSYNNNLMAIKSDFENDAYLAFIDALNYVNLEEIKNDKWKFLGPFGWYLSNLRRTYRRKALSSAREMSSNVTIGDTESNILDTAKFASMSAEDVFLHNEDEKKISYFMNNLDHFLTPEEFELSKLKRAGKPIVEIKSKMNLTTSSYYKLTKSIEMKVSTFMSM